MIGILGSTTIISEFRKRRVKQAKLKNGSKESLLNEKTHLLSLLEKVEKDFTTEEFFEEEYLSLYDCSLQIYKQARDNSS